MHRASVARPAAFALGLAFLLSGSHAAWAQRTTGGVRGTVVDDQGRGIPGVQIDMEFLGESRVKITKTQTTDKRGGFIRMGVPEGKWKFTFTKEGYQTYVMEMPLSLSTGGFSEAGEILMKAAAAPVAPAASDKPVEAVLPAAPEANKAGEAYGRGVEAAKAGQFDAAEAAFKEVLAQFPDLAAAHYNLGYVYRQKKDWKAAEAEYQRVTELEPAKSDSFIALSAVRELDGRLPEAAEGLIAAGPAFEQDAKFQYALGMTASNAGKNAEAEAAFKKATALDPANPEPLYQLATIAVGQNKVPEAVALLEKYVGMTGQNPANLETAKGLLGVLKKK
jgi:tetratricopeptide (TPR) repeat protein